MALRVTRHHPLHSRVQRSANLVRNTISKLDDTISERLVDARLNAELLPDFPGSLPETLEQAYAIQSASIDRWQDDVVAWKVAKLPATDRSRFPSERLMGPVFKSTICRLETDSLALMSVYEGGFAAVEAEYALVAEIASSPLPMLNSIGAMAVIPDFGGNCGLVIGPKISDWRAVTPRSLTVSVTIDHVKVGEAAPDAIERDPLQATRFLIELCSCRGIDLPKGTLISTGALTGVHDMEVSSTAKLDFGRFGSFKVRFEAATPIS